MNTEQRDTMKQRYIKSNVERIQRLRSLRKQGITAVPNHNCFFDFDLDRWMNPNYHEDYNSYHKKWK